VALVVVLWVIVVLSLLIGGFAFTMHVETQVTSFSRKELKADALARSGIEVARLQLLEHAKTPAEAGFHALNQKWASNDDFYRGQPLGDGIFNITVTDEQSRLPVNRLSEAQLRRLAHLLDLDMAEADVVADSILDWIDEGDLHRLNGAETDYYNELPIPYHAKNAPLDRIEELLLIKGITPELYNARPASLKRAARPGLKDILTTLGGDARINVNTAPAIVLQAMLNMDAPHVAALIESRNGSDGILGTKDDQPFRTVEEFLANFGPADPEERKLWQNLITVKSTHFRITATGEVGGVKRTLVVVLVQTGNDFNVLSWTFQRGAGGPS
jgi:general secretion pathway protein K